MFSGDKKMLRVEDLAENKLQPVPKRWPVLKSQERKNRPEMVQD